MPRIKFPPGEQRLWIEKALGIGKISTREAAEICGVSQRNFRDWRREKLTISQKGLMLLSKSLGIEIPKDIKELPDYWYVHLGARKGALKRLKKYGPPGTHEGQRKGGLVSQKKRRENPVKYRLLGCNVRKTFPKLNKSSRLAEVVGIILGDGGVTDNQLKISLGSGVDREYAKVVSSLLSREFGEKPSWYECHNKIDLCISGVELIEKLRKIGINKGNKVQMQVQIPEWIWTREQYIKSCLRGLMDTDGGAYFHHHWVGMIKYRNFGLCFTNNSKPLVFSVAKILRAYGIRNSISGENRVYVYDLKRVINYFRIIGSRNPKNKKKLDYHLSNSNIIERR